MLPAYRRLLLAGFACFAVVHLLALFGQQGTLAAWTKPVPILLLAAYAWFTGAPRLLFAGLLFSAGGDVALEFERFFFVGMGLFAVAHLCYVTLFVRHRRTFRWVVVVGYLVVWLALIALLWSGLDELRVPAALYSLLLTATAASSAGLGLRAGIGGGLFWISDALIAAGLAGWDRLPYQQVWVMSTYFVAQVLFATQSYAVSRTAGFGSPR